MVSKANLRHKSLQQRLVIGAACQLPLILMPLFRFRKARTHQKAELLWQEQSIQITRKAMKSIRLKLQYDGQLNVSCPHQVTDAQIRDFLNQRLNWITQQQQRLASSQQQVEATNHARAMCLWGQQYAFKKSSSASRNYKIDHDEAAIYLPQLPVNNEAATTVRQQIWRDELKQLMQTLLPQWQATMNVEVAFWNVKNMRTKWGSCNVTRQRVWLSLQLAQYPQQCTEMVLVHELTHLLEASHNQRFYQLMDSFLPNWREADSLLKHRTYPN